MSPAPDLHDTTAPQPAVAHDRQLPADSRLLLRAQRALLVFYAVDAAVLLGFAGLGEVPRWLPAFHLLAGAGACALNAWVLHRGWHLRIGEQRLTLVTSVFGMSMLLLVAAVAPRLATLSLMTIVTIIGTVAIRMPPRLLGLTSLLALAGILVLLTLIDGQPQALPFSTPAERVLTGLWLALLLLKSNGINAVGLRIRGQLGAANERLLEAMERLRTLALHDDLTGLLNRRSAMDWLHHQQDDHRHGGAGFAVVLLDIDHFKQVNDRFGHRTGDAVLCRFAELLQAALPPDAQGARHGGEEFLLLLQGVHDLQAARAVAEQVRRGVQGHGWAALAPGLALTVSAGVAVATTDEPVDRLLERTDQALYRAKHQGRNRVLASPAPTAPAGSTAAHPG